MRKSKSGFTIVELIVVIVVIAILATITLVVYNGVQARSRDARRKTDIANITKAMELYYSDHGSYPTSTGSTTINAAWASSVDASWATFETSLTGSQAITALPKDPLNVPSSGAANTGVMMGTTYYSYAIYVNASNYCGSAAGQMYLIVYRLEYLPKEKFSDGACTTNEFGDTYYTNNGDSYYRSVH